MIGSRRVDDPRNRLVFDFIRLAAELDTRYFVMENVPGFLRGKMAPLFDQWLEQCHQHGYGIVQPIWNLNAADFGVPQKRIRCFAVGYRYGLPLPKAPKPHVGCSPQCQFNLTPSVRDALSDLPDPTRFSTLFKSDRMPAQYGTPSVYAAHLKGDRNDPCDLSTPRPSNLDTLTGCKRTLHSANTRSRFRNTIQGTIEPISKFTRLHPDGLAPTLRAGTRLRSSGFTAARPIHPEQPRCITVREAARLHSFPDWFEPHHTVWHGFRQIGNSVPPILARAVGRRIAIALSQQESSFNNAIHSPILSAS